MSKRSRGIVLAINSCVAAAMIASAVFFMDGWGALVQTAVYGGASAFFVCGIVFAAIKRDALLKTSMALCLCFAVVYVALVITDDLAGLDRYKDDDAKLDHIVGLILKTGGWGMTVFVFLQILQVVVLPVPALICYVSGVVIWGAPVAFGLSCLGVFVGSMICYFIGRVFGRRAAYWIAGRETVDKYAHIMGTRGKLPFVLMQILPFFPDDILCIIAGLSAMNLTFFTVVMLTVRPAVIAVYCFLGSGEIIPFSGWGIAVWAVIIVLCAVLSVLVIKYRERIESFFKRKFSGGKKAPAGAEADIDGRRSSADVEPAVTEENAIKAVSADVPDEPRSQEEGEAAQEDKIDDEDRTTA